MGLGSERASNQVCLWKVSWDGAKERHPSIVGTVVCLEEGVGKR